MPWYENIFETGSHSTAFYEDDAEANRALGTHNQRAISGELGGPAGNPAERVTRSLVYPNHPADYGSTLSASNQQIMDAVEVVVNKAPSVDQVSIPDVIQAMWQEADSMVADHGPHESQFKAQEDRELELEFA